MILEKDGEDYLDWLLKNDKVLHRSKEERNILHETEGGDLTWLVAS